MKGSSRRNCKQGRPHLGSEALEASMKGSSRRNCKTEAEDPLQQQLPGLNEGQFPKELQVWKFLGQVY